MWRKRPLSWKTGLPEWEMYEMPWEATGIFKVMWYIEKGEEYITMVGEYNHRQIPE